MSNVLRHDSLLIHYLAAELEERLRGRRLLGLSLDPERRIAVLEFEGDALSWHLHPGAGWVIPGRAAVTPEVVTLARRTRVAAVRAPADERILIIDLTGPRQPGRPSRIVVELLGNQWNLLAVGPDERIVAVLWRRRAGSRELRPGQRYTPPPGAGRRGVEGPLGLDEWLDLLGAVPPAERERRLIAEVAYTSPLNARAILGEAGGGGGVGEGVNQGSPGDVMEPGSPAPGTTPVAAGPLADAHRRYLALASLPAAAPRLLQFPGGPQPYPLPLPGIPDTPCPTLLDAMAAMAGAGSTEQITTRPGVSLELLDRLRARIRSLERRRSRLTAELAEAAADAERHRKEADLLMANLYLLRKGMAEAELPDWEGGRVAIALDPALGPNENATRLYDQARKEARAAERVPALVERVESELARLGALGERAERGEATPEEVAAAVPVVERAGAGRVEAAPLPYRRYRTSGGLEVRVGRSSRGNDELTFRHSSPNDIWLHARDVAGAHVILRWSAADANPPARDLLEAAVLASLHSRARTSGTVAVDWTRRKYVRKPRKSGPGQVAFERGRTLFVEPEAEMERRLRIWD